ncbi:MAG: acid phosphatase type 7 [Thermoplasmata archaeon]|jgi:3',5'-cyclic AMP phosphodiesterase CpdA|nr:acid phosphatase type 7 [Thermoplasmata archaeon]
MRLAAALAFVVLLAPGAAATATGVHVEWDGAGYLVAFGDDATPRVSWDHGTASARQVSAPGEPDRDFVARIPAEATSYQIDGRSFDLAPRPGSNGTLRVAFLADLGSTESSTLVLDAVAAAKPDLVILGGDLSYANGDSNTWDAWLARLEPLASRVPTMTALGNHETLCAQDAKGDLAPCGSEAREYDEHFPAPDAPRRYYAFSYGPAFFVALDTEAYHHDVALRPNETRPEAQLAFLNDSLASAGDAWRIAYFHRPLYSSNAHDGGADVAAHDDFVPAFEAGGLDVALYGHAHAYERTWPLRNGTPSAGRDAWTRGAGIVYVDSGGGGDSLYDTWDAQPAWSATRAPTYEFVLLTLTPTRLRGQAIDAHGAVLDSFTIVRPGTPVPVESGARPAPAPGLAPLALATLVACAVRRAYRQR